MVCASSDMVAVPGVALVDAVPSVRISEPMVSVPVNASPDAPPVGNASVHMVVALAILPVVGVPVNESVEVMPVP